MELVGTIAVSPLTQILEGAEGRTLTSPLARVGHTSICTSGAAGAADPS